LGNIAARAYSLGTVSSGAITMRLALTLASVLLVSACVSGNTRVYYAEGVAVSTREGDAVQCEADAFDRHPVISETHYTPRRFVEPQEVCDRSGACTLTPGYFEGGDPYTVDINEEARRAATRACMIDHGYTMVTLPRCEDDAPVRPTGVMARLGAQSCVIRTVFGAEVVNPAP